MSAANAAARIRLSQIDPLPATVTPRSVREEPSAQTGSAFIILGHKAGWDLPVFVSRNFGPFGLARFAVDYTLTANADGSHTVRLAAPLGANDRICWQKWV